MRQRIRLSFCIKYRGEEGMKDYSKQSQYSDYRQELTYALFSVLIIFHLTEIRTR
jgi:hypothetical protein